MNQNGQQKEQREQSQDGLSSAESRKKKTEGQLLSYTFRGYSGKMVANYLMSFMGTIIDGIVISRFLGADAMAAFQIVMPLTMLNSVIALMFSTGLQTTCSNCLGAGRIDDANRYYTVTMLGLAPIALLFAFGVGLFATTLATVLGASGDSAYLAGEAAAYLRGVSPALGLIVFMPVLTSILFLEGKSKYSMISIACQLVINVAGDFFNAFYLHWGLLGMGLATTLCNVVGFAVMIYGKLNSKGGIGFTRVGLAAKQFLSVLTVGFPSALDRLYKTIQTFVVNHLLLVVATGTSVAAYGVLNSVNNIFTPFVMGITVTGMTMAGIFYGERDKDGLRRLFSLTLKSSVLVSILIVAVVMLAAPVLVLLFKSSSDPSFDSAVHALRIIIWMYPFYSINKMLQDYYLGSNATRMTYLVSTLENLVFIIAAVLVLGHLFGEDGVWYGFVVGEVLAVLATFIIIAVMKKRVPRTAEDMQFLPALFDKVQTTARDWSATTIDQVKEACSDVKGFMTELGASEDDATLMAQFIEDMGSIITRWGVFNGDRHYIDIRLVGIPKFDEDGNPIDGNKMETWKLRVRDNNKQFDAQKWKEIYLDDDPAQYTGIHTMAQKAKEISYAYTINLNYLFVTM